MKSNYLASLFVLLVLLCACNQAQWKETVDEASSESGEVQIAVEEEGASGHISDGAAEVSAAEEQPASAEVEYTYLPAYLNSEDVLFTPTGKASCPRLISR